MTACLILQSAGRASQRRAWAAVLAAGLMLAAGPAVAGASEPDLAGQWHLDGQEGGFTADSSGNGSPGEVNGVAPRFVPDGRFGAAFDPNGDGARVDVAPAAVLEPARVTALAWVRSHGSPGALRYVLAKGGEGCDSASYALYSGESGGLAFYVSDGAEARLSPDAGRGLWDGRWHAVAGTFDGATVRLYVDGGEVGSGTPATLDVAYGLQSRRLNLGNYPLASACPQYTTTWPGQIDEARVYSRALSAPEIAYLQSAGHTSPPSLPAPAPAPAPTATPGRGPAAPRVTALSSVAPIVAGRPALLSAEVQGDVRRIEWDVDGDGKTDVGCSGAQTTLKLRPAVSAARAARAGAFTGHVSVRAIGPGGAGPALAQAFPVAGPARVGRSIAELIAAHAPVYACGRPGDLAAASGELSVQAVTARKICLPRTVRAGTLNVEGCLEPVRRLEDIPPAERGIVRTLARALKVPVAKGSAQVELNRALDLTDSWIATGPVLVNGVELDPQGAARIVVFSQVDQIVSSDAAMSVGGIRLAHQTAFTLDTRSAPGGRIPLGAFPRLPGGVRGLGAFSLSGDVAVALMPAPGGAPAGALITTELELPDWLTIGGVRGRSRVTLRVTPDGELVLEDLHIGPLNADAGPLGISDLTLDYSRARAEWKGQGKLCVIACLDAVERPGEAPPGGIVIRNGELVRAYVNLDLPTPGIPLFAGVFLTRIGAGIALDPTRFLGGARISAFGIFRIDGTMVLAMPSQAAPFRLTREESGGGFPPQFYGRAFPRFTLALGGEAFLKIPLIGGPIRLAGGYLLYQYPGYVAFGGDVGFNFLDILELDGHAGGELNAATGRFNLGADIHACVLDVICGGAIARISSVGIGACVTAEILGESISVGGGVNYSPFAVKLWPFDGCKWSRFDEPNVFADKATAAQAGQPFRVHIGAGDRSRAIRLDGAGGAPRVRVTTPGGESLDAPGGPGVAAAGGIRILRSDKLGATVVGLEDPHPGAYTVQTLPGSAPVGKITEAEDPPDAHVSARVTGHGTRRTLVYDVRRRPGQRVTFAETTAAGGRPIGTVSGGKGRLRFTPAPGGGLRRIEARFELSGVGAETLTVASFKPPSALLARPAHVRVRRRGNRLLVSWRRVTGAQGYDVVAGGRLRVHTRRTRATLRPLTPSSAGRVSVRAVAPARRGAPRTTRFRATARRAATRFGPLPRHLP